MVRGPASSTTGPQRSSTNRLSNNSNFWSNVLHIEEKTCPITYSNFTDRCQMSHANWISMTHIESLCQPHGQCQWPHKIRCPCACCKYPIHCSYKIQRHLLTGPDQPAASLECRLLPPLLARNLPWCLSWKMSNIVNRWFLPKTSFTCDIFQPCLGFGVGKSQLAHTNNFTKNNNYTVRHFPTLPRHLGSLSQWKHQTAKGAAVPHWKP